MSDELKAIKKLYGEDMMHLCRKMFPTILEKKGVLLSILKENLAPTHSIAGDILNNNKYNEFKKWIYSFFDFEKDNSIDTNKTPFELMKEAGYKLYECKNYRAINRFKKYYKHGEKLCTFYENRLDDAYVFFAVKKNVNKIKRRDFTVPDRQDEYGTSVISIQFSKKYEYFMQIMNRYNHKVNNPDATFSNNLDNIIYGLTKSFENYYGFKVDKPFGESEFLTYPLHYVMGNDNKFYHYRYKLKNEIYHCDNNYIIKNGNVINEYAENPERYIALDQYILDLKEKTIFCYGAEDDAFIKSINNVGKIIKIDVKKYKKNKFITIIYEDNKQVEIETNNNDIIGYENRYIDRIDDYFLYHNKKLRSLILTNVKIIGDYFLWSSESLNSIVLPNVQKIGRYFISKNELQELSLPQVQIIGDSFLQSTEKIKRIYLPQVIEIGSGFMEFSNIKRIELPKVEIVGCDFLKHNYQLSYISLPQLHTIKNHDYYESTDFLLYNNIIDDESLINNVGSQAKVLKNRRR